ncbi:unnamed protein product [Effrenium voratum]|nr:unnamed protein product [Effrenium voratum]
MTFHATGVMCRLVSLYLILFCDSADGSATNISEQEVTDRVSEIMARLGEREAEMLVDFSRAAPSLGDLSHKHLVHAIAVHEDFDRPESLRFEVSWCFEVSRWSLKLYHSAPGDGWYVDLRNFIFLPSDQQEGLKKAIERQIQKQRALFPRRALVKAASEKHLRSCFKDMDGLKDLTDKMQSVRAKQAEAEEAVKKMSQCFADFFEELTEQGVDVETAAMDPWKPLCMMKATAWMAHFVELAARDSNEHKAIEDPAHLTQEMHFSFLVSLFLMFKQGKSKQPVGLVATL